MGKIRIYSPYEKALAMTPLKLTQICDVWDRHQAGIKLDVSALKAEFEGNTAASARFGTASADVQRRTSEETGGNGYIIRDGVALIPIEGVLGKRMDIFMWFSGGTSTEDLQNDVVAAANDSAVTAICYVIDSPGGEVDGTQLAANVIRDTATKKPSVAWVTGLGASAAYWLASQTSAIYLADDTTVVGSIGVVAQHVDRSGADQQRGVKRTEITAGKYKRIASDTGPLTKEGSDYIQQEVDHIYSVFVDAVANGRGSNVDQVLSDMADGRVFYGQKAIDAGLADGIATLDQVIATLNDGKVQKLSSTAASASELNPTGEVAMFTQEQLDQAVKTAREEGHAAGMADGKSQGAASELARIKAIQALRTPTNKAIVEEAMLDGTSTAEQTALKIVAADRDARVRAGEDMTAEAPAPAPAAVVDPVAKPAEASTVDASIDNPAAYAKQINEQIAKAKAEGRTITHAEADAELQAAVKK